MNRKQQQYLESVVPVLQQKFGKTNAFAVAKLAKIVVNVGFGSDPQGEKSLEPIMSQLADITGQKPKVNSSRVSIAAFKVRKGQPIGVSVTLRGTRMWQFYDKLVSLVLPQLKDFSGVSRESFDQNGSYNMGLKEQLVFPEINYDEIDRVRGMQITMTIENSTGKEESMTMLEELGMPFTRKDN